MMPHRWRSLSLAAAAALLAACSRPQHPAALAPQPAPDLAAQARRDSLAAAARRDSLAAAARADSLARLAAVRAHEDSVRAEVERGGGMDVGAAGALLPPADDSVLVTRVHFAFDKSDLTAQDRAELDRKVSLLQRYPHLRIEVAGNCDERGSDEYNLALGMRRAAAAKTYLANYGIAADRISVVSYGEERPLDPGHNETAWAANRRDDFVAKSNTP